MSKALNIGINGMIKGGNARICEIQACHICLWDSSRFRDNRKLWDSSRFRDSNQFRENNRFRDNNQFRNSNRF
jgi:hypothetical protein